MVGPYEDEEVEGKLTEKYYRSCSSTYKNV